MTKPALDEATFATAVAVLDRARHDGLHPVEALHRSGLLLSPRVENGIKVATLGYVLHELQSWSPAEFLRRRDKKAAGASPAELHRCICEYIEDLISMARKESE